MECGWDGGPSAAAQPAVGDLGRSPAGVGWVETVSYTHLMLPTWYGVGGSLVAFAEGLPVDAADDRDAPPPCEVDAPLPEAGTARWKLLHRMYRCV